MNNKKLTIEELDYVQKEVDKKGKNIFVAYILTFFFWPIGINRAYFGKIRSGAARVILTILTLSSYAVIFASSEASKVMSSEALADALNYNTMIAIAFMLLTATSILLWVVELLSIPTWIEEVNGKSEEVAYTKAIQARYAFEQLEETRNIENLEAKVQEKVEERLYDKVDDMSKRAHEKISDITKHIESETKNITKHYDDQIEMVVTNRIDSELNKATEVIDTKVKENTTYIESQMSDFKIKMIKDMKKSIDENITESMECFNHEMQKEMTNQINSKLENVERDVRKQAISNANNEIIKSKEYFEINMLNTLKQAEKEVVKEAKIRNDNEIAKVSERLSAKLTVAAEEFDYNTKKAIVERASIETDNIIETFESKMLNSTNKIENVIQEETDRLVNVKTEKVVNNFKKDIEVLTKKVDEYATNSNDIENLKLNDNTEKYTEVDKDNLVDKLQDEDCIDKYMSDKSCFKVNIEDRMKSRDDNNKKPTNKLRKTKAANKTERSKRNKAKRNKK